MRKIILVVLFITVQVSAQQKLSFRDVTENTKEITTSYFNNYINLDFDALEKLANNNISFNDTTAKLIFGIELIEGKTKVFENFKKTYAAIIEMKADIIRTIFSSNVGVFELELTYKFKAGPETVITIRKMPLVVTLTVKDGKIIEHRDYGDYNHFLEQYNSQVK